LSATFLWFFGIVGLLLALFAWATRSPGRRRRRAPSADLLEESGRRNMSYLLQIRQALAKNDLEFLTARMPREALRRVRRERCGVALAYLSALRGDFEMLLQMAQAIAALSPEVTAVEELERIRLTAKFAVHYQMIRLKLLAGFAPAAQLGRLSDFVSGLSVRMEQAVKELGERAALAGKLGSPINGGGGNIA